MRKHILTALQRSKARSNHFGGPPAGVYWLSRRVLDRVRASRLLGTGTRQNAIVAGHMALSLPLLTDILEEEFAYAGASALIPVGNQVAGDDIWCYFPTTYSDGARAGFWLPDVLSSHVIIARECTIRVMCYDSPELEA